jgi:hypothetical protein
VNGVRPCSGAGSRNGLPNVSSASLETSAEAGQLGTVTTTLKELLGHEPRTVEQFLIENAARFRS